MTTKLHINLSQGLLEVEGSEEFVTTIYNDFKERIGTILHSSENARQQDQASLSPAANRAADKPASARKGSARKSGKKSASQGYKQRTDLNLYEEGDKPSLKDYIKNYVAKSNYARYLLYTNYLKNIKNIGAVGPNEIYTCIKHLGDKVPNIEQGLRDTSFRKNWLDTSSLDDVTITIEGENAITHQLRIKTDESSAKDEQDA